jgi:hypothetical protein
MTHLTASDLMSLEQYARERANFRARVLAHKKTRQVELGPNATLYFEDGLTIQYQVQEMLRIERIFEAEGIQDELSAYNPLIPDGSNWKATFMLEYPDVEVRKRELARLVGVEDKVWVQVDGHDKVFAIADIEVLTGLDPVRRRPGMYTDTTRPNHLAQEVVDNSVDEAWPGMQASISRDAVPRTAR